MGQYPPPGYPPGYDPNNPSGYLQYETPPPKPRPTSVSVLAIIGIVLASLGLMGNLCGLLAPLFPRGLNPAMDAMYRNRVMLGWTFATAGVKMLLAAFLMAASIASLSLARWARGGMLLYSVIAIMFDIAAGLIGFLYVNPILQRHITTLTTVRQPAWATMASQIGGVCGTVLALIFPVCVLVFFTRPGVKEAFHHANP